MSITTFPVVRPLSRYWKAATTSSTGKMRSTTGFTFFSDTQFNTACSCGPFDATTTIAMLGLVPGDIKLRTVLVNAFQKLDASLATSAPFRSDQSELGMLFSGANRAPLSDLRGKGRADNIGTHLL